MVQWFFTHFINGLLIFMISRHSFYATSQNVETEISDSKNKIL
jgi:hypothetical protein